MNNANAFGFLTLGTIMQVLPFMAPSTSAVASVSDLWLHVMGGVAGSIGAGYLARVGLREVSAYFGQLLGRSAVTRAAHTARENLPLGVRVTF